MSPKTIHNNHSTTLKLIFVTFVQKEHQRGKNEGKNIHTFHTETSNMKRPPPPIFLSITWGAYSLFIYNYSIRNKWREKERISYSIRNKKEMRIEKTGNWCIQIEIPTSNCIHTVWFLFFLFFNFYLAHIPSHALHCNTLSAHFNKARKFFSQS